VRSELFSTGAIGGSGLDCSVGTSSSDCDEAGGADFWVATSNGEVTSGSAGAVGVGGTAGVGGSGLDAAGLDPAG
jgi:hypothetical protein